MAEDTVVEDEVGSFAAAPAPPALAPDVLDRIPAPAPGVPARLLDVVGCEVMRGRKSIVTCLHTTSCTPLATPELGAGGGVCIPQVYVSRKQTCSYVNSIAHTQLGCL